MRKFLKGLGYLFLALLVASPIVYTQRAELVRWFFDLPEFQSEYVSQTLNVTMRDGILLETHIFTPEGEGPWPTVLIRDPYSTSTVMCKTLARYNYACVHQDVRGRYGSEGAWYPFINERRDGLDTLDWLIEQPFQDGRIATYGGSYLGAVQWTMIDEMPEQVKTVIADVSHGDWFQIAHKNGHYMQGVASEWALGLHESEATLSEFVAVKPAIYANRQHLNGEKQWLLDYMSNEDKDGEYWGSEYYQTVRDAHKKAAMPVLMMGGWHDFFIDGQFDVFEALPRRDDSLFVVRNGAHGANSYADFSFSVNTALQWLARYLKKEETKTLPESGYLLQDNVDSSRQHLDQWPDATTENTFHLGQLSQAKSCDGGVLQFNEPSVEQSISYVYDPVNPVPSRGGSNNFNKGVEEQGSDLCEREDVLSFESKSWSKGKTISGAMQVTLNVKSDADDSAFTVKVQEKMADGRVLNIRDGITSLSFRNGALSRQRYTANTEVELVFDLTPIQWTLQPGSSVRLDVSSSNFPYYNAHPNTDQLWSALTGSKKATQTLLGGKLTIPLK